MNFILNNKLFFLIIFLILENNLIQSQDTDIVGFRSGLVISNQNWITKEDQRDFPGNNKTGLVCGLYYSHSFSKIFSLQSEMNYLQEGSKLSSSWDEKGAVFSLDYISFLVSPKFKFQFHKVLPYFQFGPRFDILFRDAMDGSWKPGNLDQIDYGYTVGCGIEFLFSKHVGTNFEVRYNQSLNKVASFATTADAISVQNHSFEMTIGIGLK